jgi:C-terminal processing protease CtpA/Prc
LFLVGCSFANAQKYSKFDRDRAEQMLRDAAADVKKYYYDPKFHGLDWDAEVQQAKQNLDKADSIDASVSEVAALLDRLKDSHTYFIPPPRTHNHKYGFKLKMIGEHCYVTRITPDSDAQKKGLKVGDQVFAVNDVPETRKTFWKIQYVYNYLRPQPGLRLTLAGEGGQPRQMDVMANIEVSSVIKYGLHQGINQIVRDWNEEERLLEPQYFEKGEEFLAIRIPEFTLSAGHVDAIIGRMRKHRGVVLDLRGNPGGFEDTLDRLLGGMFQNDVKIYDRVRRDSTKSVTAAGHHHDSFTGRLAVLIDSDSASASELFARVVQLEKRAFVVGDRSSGMVMEAKGYPHELLLDSNVYYGQSVTDADLIMTDGKSLEKTGVDPDILVLPTPQDLASKKDPTMAKAAGLIGVRITPEEAGGMFPDKKPKG